MTRIYPPAYGHYWKDGGTWYLNEIYSKYSLKADLHNRLSSYNFIRYSNKTIGIFKLDFDSAYPPFNNQMGLKIHRLYIDPEFQGKRIGTQLMHYAQEIASRKNYKFIWLEAMHTHEQAQSFYKQLGFEMSGVRALEYPLLHDTHRPIWFLHKML